MSVIDDMFDDWLMQDALGLHDGKGWDSSQGYCCGLGGIKAAYFGMKAGREG